ncbi:MAG: amidohydrolase [Bacteroidetes bacterium]|nr:amidohydrolase [Bacteroidota bacterium]
MNNKKSDNPKLISLRKHLHSIPDLSGNESNTSNEIIKFISDYSPDEIITNIGGNGLAFIFNGKFPGKTIMFRSELDALPITETNDFDYKSVKKNISHKCGHDGHMSILAGVASLFSTNRSFSGKLILLFQAAEETGTGAFNVINDKKFKLIKPDYIFALHNVPGFPLGSILVNDNIFSSASKGMIINLKGKTSHAAFPEHGISPAFAMANIINGLKKNSKNDSLFSNFVLITIIHAKLGEEAFGTTPENAQIMATLRSFQDKDMLKLTQTSEKIVKDNALKYSLDYDISYTEQFLATYNNGDCVEFIKNAASQNNYQIINIKEPFRWSEDFSHFTKNYSGAMFGLGAGEYHPDLHKSNYDFPDELIKFGMNMFSSILKNISSLKLNNK